ncbi:MAG: hypothetical protein H0U53_04100 [Actinobacteria bacterium]|nr:hypothetical protein [Actinomycetota bacterium]
MTRVVRIPLDDSRSFLAEVDDLHLADEDLITLSRTDVPVDRAVRGLDDSLDEIVPVAERIFERLKEIQAPRELEIKLGLKITGEAGVIFSKVGGEASFEVTLKWDRSDPPAT